MSLQRVKKIPHQSLSIHEAKVSRSFLEESMLLQQIDLTMSPMTNLVKLITSSFPLISMIYDHKQCPMSHATPISILRGHALVLYLQLANWFPPWFQAGSNNDEEWLLKDSSMNSPRQLFILLCSTQVLYKYYFLLLLSSSLAIFWFEDQ